MKFELFHRLANLESAAVRRFVQENGLKERVDFRNVDISESALGDLKTRGGADNVPALWTGEQMLVGRAAIEKFLLSIKA